MGQDKKPDELSPRFQPLPVVKIDNFVRKQTTAIGVDELNQKGITKINFLTLGKINELVAVAVQRALEKYRRTVEAPEAGKIVESAREEVAREILERRIEKLQHQVVELEASLSEVSREREEEAEARAAALFIPLAPGQPSYEKKREMLQVIFEENLQLQKAGRQ